MVEAQDGPIVKKKGSTKFGANILKLVQGEEKARAAFQSISMQAIPRMGSTVGEKKNNSTGLIQKSHSLNEIGDFFANKLLKIKDKIGKE